MLCDADARQRDMVWMVPYADVQQQPPREWLARSRKIRQADEWREALTRCNRLREQHGPGRARRKAGLLAQRRGRFRFEKPAKIFR